MKQYLASFDGWPSRLILLEFVLGLNLPTHGLQSQGHICSNLGVLLGEFTGMAMSAQACAINIWEGRHRTYTMKSLQLCLWDFFFL
jgi:hypothetical protein